MLENGKFLIAFQQNNLTFCVRLSEIFECLEAAAHFGILPSLGKEYFSASQSQDTYDDEEKIIIGSLNPNCSSIPQEYIATGSVYPTNGLTVHPEAKLLFEFSPAGNNGNTVLLPLDALVAAVIRVSWTEAVPNTGEMCIPELPYHWWQAVLDKLLVAQYL